jgi:hypothetical protein
MPLTKAVAVIQQMLRAMSGQPVSEPMVTAPNDCRPCSLAQMDH